MTTLMDGPAQLGETVRELREARGYRKAELAALVDVHQTYIHKIEIGRVGLPSAGVLRKLAAALGTTPDVLLEAAGYLEPSPLAQGVSPELLASARGVPVRLQLQVAKMLREFRDSADAAG